MATFYRRWFKVGTGAAVGVISILGLFLFLQAQYGFIINDLTGDIVCEGTYDNPCISYFDVKNPTRYNIDIYNEQEVKLDFAPDVEDYALFIQDKRCSATGSCRCELADGRMIGFEDWRCIDFTNKTKPVASKKYVYRFPAYSTKHFMLAGLKENPSDEVKWTFFTPEAELDPVWKGVSKEKEDNIEHTQTTDTYINEDGSKTIILYSGVANVYEDNTWKKIKDARSLKNKGFYVVYLEDDKDFPLEVIDFNFTSITIDLKKSSKQLNKDIPIRVWEYNQTKQNEVCINAKTVYDFEVCKGKHYKEVSNKKMEETEKFTELSLNKRKTYDFNLGSLLEFGFESTTIKLQDNITENLGDARVVEYVPDTNYPNDVSLIMNTQSSWDNDFYIKFNISAIPVNSEIEDSDIYFYHHETLGTKDSVNLYHVYSNASWNETTITWNNQPCGPDFTIADNCSLIGNINLASPPAWRTIDTTTAVNNSYNWGWNNISFGGLDNGNYYAYFYSRDYTTDVTLRPYLNITYIPIIEDETILILNSSKTIIEDHFVFEAQANTVQSNGDLYLNSDPGNRRELIIKFVIDGIPANAQIEEAKLSLWIEYNLLDAASEYFNVSANKVYQHYNWSDSTITWNKRPIIVNDFENNWESEFFFFGGVGEPISEFINFTVTNALQSALGNNNISFYLHTKNDSGTVGSTDYVRFTGVEDANIAERPFIYVKYTLGTGTSLCPAYGGTGNYNLNCSDSCWIREPYNIDGNFTLKSLNGDGIIYLNYTTNFTDSSQFVIINSGCDLSIESGGKLG